MNVRVGPGGSTIDVRRLAVLRIALPYPVLDASMQSRNPSRHDDDTVFRFLPTPTSIEVVNFLADPPGTAVQE